MYGDVHVRVVVEVLLFFDSVFEGDDDGTKLGSLACGFWMRPHR